MKFYQYPLNYGSKRAYAATLFVPEVQDNNYSTTWTGTSLTIHIDSVGDGTGTARDFDTIFIKCNDASSISITETSTTIPVATTVSQHNRDHSIVDEDGYLNILHSLSSKASQQSLTFNFNTGIKVAQIMILNEDKEVEIESDNRFVQIDYNESHRGASINQTWTGALSYSPPINNTRPKWEIDCSVRYRDYHPSYNKLRKFFRDNNNFVVAVDYPLDAELVFPCVVDTRRQLRYITTYKYTGRDYTFGLREI